MFNRVLNCLYNRQLMLSRQTKRTLEFFLIVYYLGYLSCMVVFLLFCLCIPMLTVIVIVQWSVQLCQFDFENLIILSNLFVPTISRADWLVFPFKSTLLPVIPWSGICMLFAISSSCSLYDSLFRLHPSSIHLASSKFKSPMKTTRLFSELACFNWDKKFQILLPFD